MPARQDSYTISIPTSPPPPQDIGSYSRFIHDHTKRLMEQSGGPSTPRSAHAQASAALTNGGAVPA